MKDRSNLVKRVVTIGGGTGTYPVVAALRQLIDEVVCIVAVSDSGGSSARLRDEFGFPPVGDLRQSLTALADPETQQLLQQLLLYRFEKGGSLRGHSLGNLILTALQDITGSTTQALVSAAQLFQFHGQVIPVTEDSVDLKIFYTDGTTIVGEHHLDKPTAPTKPIDTIELVPTPITNRAAIQALKRADHILIGPGDIYASLYAVLRAPKIARTIQQSQATITYIVNIMTRRSQTNNYTAAKHVATIETALGKPVNTIVLNTRKPSKQLLEPYSKVGEYLVTDDLSNDDRVIRAPLVTRKKITLQQSDAIPRSLLRHDSEELKRILKRIIFPK